MLSVIVKGQEQIADLFGVTVKTINEWQADGFPIALRGTFGRGGVPNEYDSAECIRWLVERELDKVRGESPKDRLARMQADSIEFDIQIKRGEFIPAKEIEPRLRAAIVTAREHLLGVAARIESDPVRRSRIQTEHEAFLLRLANWPQAHRLDDEGDEPEEEDADGEDQ